jgi:hypothetical protein
MHWRWHSTEGTQGEPEDRHPERLGTVHRFERSEPPPWLGLATLDRRRWERALSLAKTPQGNEGEDA